MTTQTRPQLAVATAVAAATLLATWTLWGDGLPRGHDLLFELVRAAEFDRAVEAGALRPRWATNLLGGYGYPIFNFFPPLLLSLTSGLTVVGLSLTAASKLALTALAGLGALGSSLCGRWLWGLRGALLLPILTAAAPYALHDLTVRSAWSEWTALQLAPLTLAAVLWSTRQPGLASALALGVVSTLQLCAHNLSLLLWLPVWLVGMAVGLRAATDRRAALRTLVGGGLLGLGLAASYWLPLAMELRYVGLQWRPGGAFGVQANLLAPAGLLDPEWRGVALVGGAAAAAAGVLAALRPQQRLLWLGGCVAVLGGFWLVLTPSWPLWEALAPLQLVMFPWRLFSPVGFVAAVVLCGAAVAFDGSRTPETELEPRVAPRLRWTVLPLLAAVAGVLLMPRFGRADLEPLAHHLPALRRGFATTTVLDEYLPTTVQTQPDVPADQPAASGIAGAALRCSPPEQRDVRCEVNLPEPGEVVVRRLAFPGWSLTLDGQPAEARISKRGTYVVAVPAGDHVLEAMLMPTPIQQAGNAVSLATLLLVLGLAGLGLWAGRLRRPN